MHDNHDKTRHMALRAARRLWCVSIVALLTATVLMGLSVTVAPLYTDATHSHLARHVLLIGSGLLIAGLLLCMYLRGQIYKRCWRGHAVTPRGYVIANVVALVLLMIPASLGFTAAIFDGKPLPGLLLPMMAVLLIMLQWPDGKPMRPHEPMLGESAGNRMDTRHG